MDQMTDSVIRTQRRRAAELAEREARVAAPDRVAELVAEHDRIAVDAKARQEMVVPTGRGPVIPEPSSRYQNDYVSMILPDGRGLHASFLLETILRNPKGLALAREVMRAIGAER